MDHSYGNPTRHPLQFCLSPIEDANLLHLLKFSCSSRIPINQIYPWVQGKTKLKRAPCGKIFLGCFHFCYDLIFCFEVFFGQEASRWLIFMILTGPFLYLQQEPHFKKLKEFLFSS